MLTTVNDYIEAGLTHSLHTSSRLSFRGCRRRWDWLTRQGWYPQVTPKPLEFGSAFHKALETWYDPQFWNRDADTRLKLTIIAFNRACGEQRGAYLALNSGTDNEARQLDPEMEQDFKERRELGEGMLTYHCTRVSPVEDAKLTPVRVEIEFEVPITNPKGGQLWCRCKNCWELYCDSKLKDVQDILEQRYVNRDGTVLSFREQGRGQAGWKGLPVTYGGRIDCLMEDEFGNLWVVDWKTAARLSGQEEGDSPDEYILLDDQITSYLWALWLLGFNVAGFIHHEIKKAFPVEPEPLKTRREGRWYSVNKQQNTSYAVYKQTVAEGDPAGLASGAYDEFLAWLQAEGTRYYSRKKVWRSEAELANAGRNIYLEALEMTDDNLRIYPSPGRFACSFCAFRQPCLGMNRDEDVEYMLVSNFEKKDPRYWIKTAPSTETKGGR